MFLKACSSVLYLTCVVHLTAPPVIQYEEQYKNTQVVKAGGTLTIPITVSGNPAPKITWHFGDKQLKTANGTTVETSDTASRLIVKNVTAAQIGTYRVKAENSAGSDEAQFTTALKGITNHVAF
jgi:Immunoglobulin I-set domain